MMRAGRVARIRVSPADCMLVVDLCRAVGLDPRGMSWGQAVSTTFSTLAEVARKQGIVPRRDGFEYNEMMASFGGMATERRASAIASSVHPIGLDRIPTTLEPVSKIEQVARDKLDRRWNELQMRKQMTPENMSVEEERELEALHKELGYPAVKAGGTG